MTYIGIYLYNKYKVHMHVHLHRHIHTNTYIPWIHTMVHEGCLGKRWSQYSLDSIQVQESTVWMQMLVSRRRKATVALSVWSAPSRCGFFDVFKEGTQGRSSPYSPYYGREIEFQYYIIGSFQFIHWHIFERLSTILCLHYIYIFH